MTGERLIRVTSEAELRVGMIVVVIGCDHCDSDTVRHRFLLVRKGIIECGEHYDHDGWGVEPDPHPDVFPDCESCWCLWPDGTVFRVDDHLEEAPAEAQRRIRELVAPRKVVAVRRREGVE